MKVYYRISDGGYNKVKPSYVNNENCLRNFTKHFGSNDITIIADNVSDATLNMIRTYIANENIIQCKIGNGAGTFTLAFEEALKLSDDTLVYFVENDYIHRTGADRALKEAFMLNVDYVTLYDHPDKYMPRNLGGNKLCKDNSEETRVFLTNSCHWKITNSTTMTFAALAGTLKDDEDIIRKFTNGYHPETGQKQGHPYDFSMFLELGAKGRRLISPLPGYSTHGESYWLTKLIDWEKEI